MSLRLICATMAATFLATVSVAETEPQLDVCAYDPTNPEESLYPFLIGNWTVHNGSGYAVAPNFYHGFGPEADANADFRMVGDRLSVLDWSGETTQEFPVTFFTEAFPEDNELDGPSVEEALMVVGTECDYSTIPSIHVDGGFWSATLAVISSDQMFGLMVFQVEGMTGYRRITMSR